MREPDLANQVRLTEPVEGLAGCAGEERGCAQKEDERRAAGETRALACGHKELSQLRAFLVLLAPSKAGLGHGDECQQADGDGQRARDDDREAQVIRRDGDAEPEAEECARVAEPLAADEHGADLVRPHLVGDPGLVRAAHERVSEPPQRPRDQDRDEVGHEPDERPGDALQQDADDDRELPPVGVGEDTGRDLEDEDGYLHHGADEDQLQRVEPDLANEVDGDHDKGRHREQELEGVEGCCRRRSPHSGLLSGSEAIIFTPTDR